ncbi:MAG TPA: BglII/BstYI family type II restriction endonuclease [Candidatus Methylacidiphilales bacterium]|jgi:hypothetical protein|nr:BglII/BstYI family type II restriction endonuclease [Candidatus Methylacidiphilales bacterium]
MALDKLPRALHAKYEIHEWRHASAILLNDFPSEWADILDVLNRFVLKKSYIVTPGGSKSAVSIWMDKELTAKGWRERKFDTSIKVDEVEFASPTHKVDCFKNRIGLEIEWNNKDPFFDRDLNNFRLLFELRTIAVGIIVTRCDELQDIFAGLGRGSSYGNSTTHMSKLLPRLEGGAGGGCPILVLGIRKALYDSTA